MRQQAVIVINAGSWPQGPLLVGPPVVIDVFTAGPAYDLVVNTVTVFAATSYIEQVV